MVDGTPFTQLITDFENDANVKEVIKRIMQIEQSVSCQLMLALTRVHKNKQDEINYIKEVVQYLH